MDSNFSQFLAERNRSQQPQLQLQLQQATPPETAPPPYSASSSDSDDSDDSDDFDSDDESPGPSPVRLIINAAHNIQGSNNLVPTSATPLADASKFGTLLLHAVNQINGLNSNPAASRRQALKVDLTINCGLTVVGDRNVIGHVGLKPRAIVAGPNGAVPAATPPTNSAVGGAKRKAEEITETADEALEPASKKVAVEF